MKKTFIFATILFLLASNLVQAGKEDWKTSMWGLLTRLDSLMLDAVSESSWKDPKNQNRIQANLIYISATAQKVKTLSSVHGSMADKDPTLKILSQVLSDQTAMAQKSFLEKQYEWSRHNVKILAGTCLECHTRTSSGPRYKGLTSPQILKSLTPLEQAEFLIATRQFAEAQKVLVNFLTNPNLKEETFVVEKAAAMGLLLSVRLDNDPKQASDFIKIFDGLAMPKELSETVAAWNKSIIEWQKDLNALNDSPQDLIKNARRLLEVIRKNRRYAFDTRVLVERLRATNLLHEALSQGLSAQKESTALYLLGQAYDGMEDLGLWSLSELFYDACVSWHPAQKEANSCLDALRHKVTLGYTGSGGTQIPDDIEQRLMQLQNLIEDKKGRK